MNDVTEKMSLSMIYYAADPGSRLRKAQLAQGSDCRMLTEIPICDWVNCHAVPTALNLLGVILSGQSREVKTVFAVSDLQAVGISSVQSGTDEWLLNACVHCKRTAHRVRSILAKPRSDALHFVSRWPTATVGRSHAVP